MEAGLLFLISHNVNSPFSVYDAKMCALDLCQLIPITFYLIICIIGFIYRVPKVDEEISHKWIFPFWSHPNKFPFLCEFQDRLNPA